MGLAMGMSSPVKVLLIEDSPEYRRVIGTAFERDKKIDLIHATGTAERALKLLESSRPDAFPDLVLLDLNLPGMNGLSAVSSLRAVAPNVPILVLTQSDKEQDVFEAIKAGATGYLLKSSGIKQIKDGIMSMMNGGSPIDSKIAQYILNTIREEPSTKVQINPLTPRELEILTFLADGLLKKQIGERLIISEFTVQAHARHIYEKLQVQNAPAAISEAYKKGILPVK